MKLFFLILFLLVHFTFFGQSLYFVPKLNFTFSGFGYTKKNEKPPNDFNYFNSKIVGLPNFSLILKNKNHMHELIVANTVQGASFNVFNQFNGPGVLNKGVASFGGSRIYSSFSVAYMYKRVNAKINNFIFKQKVQFHYGAGFSYVIAKSNKYYLEYQNDFVSGGSPYDYYEHETNTYKKGNGLLLLNEAGFWLFNKKNKPYLVFNAYLNLGLRQIQHTTIDYRYGSLIIPANQVEHKNIEIKTRGGNFGFKVGIPIKLKNIKK